MSDDQLPLREDSATYDRDKVVQIINTVIQRFEGAEEFSKDRIYQELKDLHQIILDTRQSLGAANPGEISETHIPAATDELDAVISATEEATGAIMDSCETIETEAEKLESESAQKLTDAVTKIYEACSFQDITGQRITKVVQSLQQIDEKVGHLLEVLEGSGTAGQEASKAASGVEGADREENDRDLMNGPQMPDKAISQDEIDKLLSEFD